MFVYAQVVSRVWLCDFMDCSPPISSVHCIFQARLLEGLLFPISGDLSNPDMGSVSLKSLELQVDSLPTESSRKPFWSFFFLFLSFLLYIKSIFKSFVYRCSCSNTSDPNGHCIQDLARCTHLCHDNPYHILSFILSLYNLKFFSVSNISQRQPYIQFPCPI